MKLIDLRLKANPGGFGPTEISESDESGQLSGQLHIIEQDTEVRVAKIVHSMKPE